MNYENEIDLKRLVLAIRRQFPLVFGTTAAFLLLAQAYLFIATPQYTAETLLFLDRSITQAVSENSSVKNMGFETAAIESEVEVIRSRDMANAVIDYLKSKNDPAGLSADDQDKDERIQQILHGLRVNRIGETYVLSIQYTAEDPWEAADFANAYANTYIEKQLSSLFEVSSRTVTWMKSKIEDLGQQSINAQKTVTDYRKKYNESKLGRNHQSGTVKNSPEDTDKAGLAELNNLQKEADTYKTLYESSLERLETLNMQQSYPITETRIISQASPPTEKSHPVAIIILGAALILGAGFSILLALLIDNFDKTLRRGGQVKREIGVPFLGFFPERKKHKKSLPFVSSAGKSTNFEMNAGSIIDPYSLNSETIRSIRHAIDDRLGDGKHVIGIVSAEQAEGKSVIASNLALYTAQYASTVLIDADIRSASKTKQSRNNKNEKGLEDILLGKASLKEALLHCKTHNISFLPSMQHDVGQTLAFLDAGKVKKLIDECKKQHDYIIIEFPPLISTADVYSFARSVDCIVVVAEWGKTLPNNLNFHLQQNGIESSNILGIVLENTDMVKMKKLYGHKVYS